MDRLLGAAYKIEIKFLKYLRKESSHDNRH